MMKLLTPLSSVLLVVVSFHWASENASSSSCVALAAVRTIPRILPLEASSAVGKSSKAAATIQPAPTQAPASSSSSSESSSSSSLLTACVPPPKNKYAALAAAVTSSQFEMHRRALDWYAYTTTPTVAVAPGARTPEQEGRRGHADTARTDNAERKVVSLASWRPGNFVDGTMTDPPEEW